MDVYGSRLAVEWWWLVIKGNQWLVNGWVVTYCWATFSMSIIGDRKTYPLASHGRCTHDIVLSRLTGIVDDLVVYQRSHCWGFVVVSKLSPDLITLLCGALFESGSVGWKSVDHLQKETKLGCPWLVPKPIVSPQGCSLWNALDSLDGLGVFHDGTLKFKLGQTWRNPGNMSLATCFPHLPMDDSLGSTCQLVRTFNEGSRLMQLRSLVASRGCGLQRCHDQVLQSLVLCGLSTNYTISGMGRTTR